MKKYITIAALLAAGTALANAEELNLATLTKIDSGDTSRDGVFSVVLSFDINKLKSYLKKGQTPQWTSGSFKIITYQAAGVETGVVINGGSYNNKINTSYLYDCWDGSYSRKALTSDLASLDWDNITGAGLTYTFDKDNGTSVAFALNGIDFAVNYATDPGLKARQAGDATITLGDMVKNAWLSDTALSEDDAKGYAAFAAAVPEPSAFGFLAGISALVLVASRRRRK